jgi:hypothetical protein
LLNGAEKKEGEREGCGVFVLQLLLHTAEREREKKAHTYDGEADGLLSLLGRDRRGQN